ncbi:MAG: adenosylcobinamide-GDP ribazoletransferase [Deltaproteobacteria bacterium]|nr:adenosylcobinamide-GDP ribazoletransferase [Deltaproteobacteria bacterium]
MTAAVHGTPRSGALRHALVAFQFLTRIPMPRDLNPSPGDLGRATGWFPVVGVVVGALIAAVGSAAMGIGLSPGIAAVIAVGFGLVVTGSFHEDGLADSADAFGGGWNREQVLTIMHDSRIGSYGSGAVTLLFAARLAALWSIDPAAWTASLIAAHTVARWTSVHLLHTKEYARRDGEAPGFGKPIVDGMSGASFWFATVVTTVVAVFAFGLAGFVTLVAALVLSELWGRYCRRRIGGITGDALGAVNVAVEVFTLVGCALRFPATVSPWITP